MSEYFYLVNHCDHNVLEIEEGMWHGDLHCIRQAVGAANQLWKWDDMGRLVNKLGPNKTITIKNSNENEGACLHVYPAHDGLLNQQWWLEDGLIKSYLNGLVLTVDTEGRPKMMAGKYNFEKREHWDLVPEECLAEYKNALQDQNPFTEAVYRKKVADNYMHAIIGYDIKVYEHKMEKVCEVIEGCAEKLDKKDQAAHRAKVGVQIGLIGGAVAIAGAVLAPFTFGASIPIIVSATVIGITEAGAGVAIAGGAIALIEVIISGVWNKQERYEIRVIVGPAFRETVCLTGFQDNQRCHILSKYKKGSGLSKVCVHCC